METEGIQLLFKKGHDSVTISNNNIKTEFSISIDHTENECFVEIPAFNISLSTKHTSEIDASVHESLLSFFNYKLKVQGVEKFIGTMLELGFTIKGTATKKRKSSKVKYYPSVKPIVRHKEEEFVLSI
ncbi:MAG: hypothetical protein ACO1O6_12230 [Bacteroidota bacterium]